MHTKKLVYVITYQLSLERKNMVSANESAQFREELTKNWNEVMGRKRVEKFELWKVWNVLFKRKLEVQCLNCIQNALFRK